MPGFNGSGPLGNGPAGGGRGPCAGGMGMGAGRSFGGGFRRFDNVDDGLSQEVSLLRRELERMEGKLNELQN